MALPVIASTVRFACTGTGGSGQPYANVLHLKHGAGAPTAGDIAAAAAKLAFIYDPAINLVATQGWLKLMHTTAGFGKITATVLDGISASVSSTYGFIGGDATDSLPPGVAVVVSEHTAKRGRSYRGRVYLPAPAEAYSDSVGHFSAVQATAVVTLWNAILAALSGIGWTWVVASYLHATVEPVTAFTVDTVFDSQRRRKV